MGEHHHHSHQHEHSHYHLHSNERSTKMVVFISVIAMVLELWFGYASQSVALIMDGWHMLSHVLVIVLAWGAYWYARRRQKNISAHFERRILSLSAFASSMVLFTVTVFMVIESVEKLRHPDLNVSNGALLVAVVGLVVNGLSAFFLHREEEKMDLNLRAAYLHVLSDVVISLLAIVALTGARFSGWQWLDPVCALLGSAIILKWAIELIRRSWREVLG